MAHVPPGVQCFVGGEVRRRRAIEDTVTRVFEGWDYEEIIPPLFDYADVFATPGLASRTYSFLGRDGSVLALRPDFTSLLAKIAAGRLAHRPAPMRLYYSGEVLRYEPPRAGRQSELYQMGLEHLGGSPPHADAETLAIAAECLDALGINDAVLAVGHVGVFHALVTEAGLDGSALAEVRDRVEAKDASGVTDALSAAGVPSRLTAAFAGLAGLSGGPSVLDEAARLLEPWPAARRSLDELREIVTLVRAAGLGDRVAVDLGEVRGLDYYTGLVFRAFAPGLGFEIGSGGRYDQLLARFGRPLPAVGFMLGLDRVALLLERRRGNGSDDAPAAEPLPDLGRARARRRDGARVRLDAAERP